MFLSYLIAPVFPFSSLSQGLYQIGAEGIFDRIEGVCFSDHIRHLTFKFGDLTLILNENIMLSDNIIYFQVISFLCLDFVCKKELRGHVVQN